MANAREMTAGAAAAPGLDGSAMEEWLRSEPTATGVLFGGGGDGDRYGAFWGRAADLLARLPAKVRRSEAEAAAAASILARARASRERFLIAHAATVYDALTQNQSRFLRLEELAFAAAELAPGLTPTRQQMAEEDRLLLKEKEGLEVDQGIFLAHMLADETRGKTSLPRHAASPLRERGAGGALRRRRRARS